MARLPRLEDVNSIQFGDAAIGWRWWVRMPDLGDLPARPGVRNINELPPGFVQQISFSPEQYGAVARQFGGRERHFAKSISIDTLNITFFENNVYDTLAYLMKWGYSIISDKGEYGMPGTNGSGYKRNIDILLYGDSSVQEIATFKCFDCYPAHPQNIDLDYLNTNRTTQIPIQFAVDRIVPVIGEVYAANLLEALDNIISGALSGKVPNNIGNVLANAALHDVTNIGLRSLNEVGAGLIRTGAGGVAGSLVGNALGGFVGGVARSFPGLNGLSYNTGSIGSGLSKAAPKSISPLGSLSKVAGNAIGGLVKKLF